MLPLAHKDDNTDSQRCRKNAEPAPASRWGRVAPGRQPRSSQPRSSQPQVPAGIAALLPLLGERAREEAGKPESPRFQKEAASPQESSCETQTTPDLRTRSEGQNPGHRSCADMPRRSRTANLPDEMGRDRVTQRAESHPAPLCQPVWAVTRPGCHCKRPLSTSPMLTTHHPLTTGSNPGTRQTQNIPWAPPRTQAEHLGFGNERSYTSPRAS